jgi:hypothetical protein
MDAKNSGPPGTIRVALATCSELPQLDADTQWLVAALKKRGVHVTPAVWDDPKVDWAKFDLVVVRSCWDYASRRDEFLAWVEQVPHLMNTARILTWNTNKQYLSDLMISGIPVIPTTWIGPEDQFHIPEEGEWVIKPAVSIASLDTRSLPNGNQCAASAGGRACSPAATSQTRDHDAALHGRCGLRWRNGHGLPGW